MTYKTNFINILCGKVFTHSYLIKKTLSDRLQVSNFRNWTMAVDVVSKCSVFSLLLFCTLNSQLLMLNFSTLYAFIHNYSRKIQFTVVNRWTVVKTSHFFRQIYSYFFYFVWGHFALGIMLLLLLKFAASLYHTSC
jgi:hypothetical protein